MVMPDGNNGMKVPDSEKVAMKLGEISNELSEHLSDEQQSWLMAANHHLKYNTYD